MVLRLSGQTCIFGDGFLPSQVCNQPKMAFKKSVCKALFAALEGEEDYIEAPNLLSKINLYFT